MKKGTILFDFAGTLVEMRPAKLSMKRSLLKRLSKKYNLGIITGGSRTEVENIIGKLKIRRFFSDKSIITKQDSLYSKPEPKLIRRLENSFSTKRTLYIGDRLIDYKMANAAKIPFIYIGKRKLGNEQIKNSRDLNIEMIEKYL
ncbi:MAG TPA: HAD family hydrolase [Patescibacteria group bacterium]|nr:HAD family hydrolase [Patescibacteria group bacterium]